MDLTTARAIVQAAYITILFRDPDEPFWTFDASALVDGSLPADGLAQQLYATPERAVLVTLPDYPIGAAIVGTYQQYAGRVPTVAELDTWAQGFRDGTRTQADLVAALQAAGAP